VRRHRLLLRLMGQRSRRRQEQRTAMGRCEGRHRPARRGRHHCRL